MRIRIPTLLIVSLCATLTASVESDEKPKLVPNQNFGATNKTHFTLAYQEVSRDQWQQAEVKEDEESLTAFGEIVMARDETPYMEALAKLVTSATPNGTILEVGFGMGISAGAIEKNGCGKHVIIEANRAIMRKCLKWAESQPSVVVPLYGFWESVTTLLGNSTFDGIFFDPFPSTVTLAFMMESRRLLRPGGILTYYLQQWGDKGTKAWNKSKRMLLKAGFTEHEIQEPEYMQLDIREDCGPDRDCPMRKITMIIPQIVRAQETSENVRKEL